MGCSSVGEKNKDESGGGKLKESLLTLLIKNPLLIGSISSQFSGENSFNEVGKTGSKSTRNPLQNSPQMAQFIGLQKLAVGGLTELSVDHPVDWQRSEIRPLGLRSTGRSTG